MGKQVIHAQDGRPTFPFLSPAIRAGDFIYLSGNVGFLPGQPPQGKKGKNGLPGELVDGGIEAQSRQTIENLRALLEAAGATLDDIVKINTYLRDIDRDFQAYNGIYEDYFQNDPPTRTTVEAKLLYGILIEIECVAYKPQK